MWTECIQTCLLIRIIIGQGISIHYLQSNTNLDITGLEYKIIAVGEATQRIQMQASVTLNRLEFELFPGSNFIQRFNLIIVNFYIIFPEQLLIGVSLMRPLSWIFSFHRNIGIDVSQKKNPSISDVSFYTTRIQLLNEHAVNYHFNCIESSFSSVDCSAKAQRYKPKC